MLLANSSQLLLYLHFTLFGMKRILLKAGYRVAGCKKLLLQIINKLFGFYLLNFV